MYAQFTLLCIDVILREQVVFASSNNVVSSIEKPFSAGIAVYFHEYYSKTLNALSNARGSSFNEEGISLSPIWRGGIQIEQFKILHRFRIARQYPTPSQTLVLGYVFLKIETLEPRTVTRDLFATFFYFNDLYPNIGLGSFSPSILEQSKHLPQRSLLHTCLFRDVIVVN